ncbi:hypothetical protein FRC08_007345 [Ceratobasidium sp. 394]|nr:hypothetical protein FRC08_007345 [Ceratobasidium sp. 394]KAG9100239.1 hypothetical protein FS749_015877 [Ceratobasidium sp. UAMH 11750]
MPGFPKLNLIDRSAFPSMIRMPNIVSYTGEVLKTKVNPKWKEAEAGSYAWFDSYGLVTGRKRQVYFNAGFGLMGALAFADAELERLRPAMDFILWLFAFDDLNDVEGLEDVNGAKRTVDDVMNVLRNPDTARPESRVAACLHNFFDRMRMNSSPATMERFVEAIDLYTKATLQQTANRSVDDVPTIDEYIQLRRDTSAVKIMYPILEYSLGLHLPETVHEDPIIAELLLAGNDLLTWANDVYSFPVEQARGDTHNLVFIVMWNEGLDLEGAIDHVDKLLRKRLQEYVDAKAQLRSFGPEVDAQVAQYVQGVEYGVQGSISWTFMTPRYFGTEAEAVRDTHIVSLMVPARPNAPISV